MCVSLSAPPMFLPISSTPQPERRQPAQRRHSIEKETPTSVRQFLPPSRHSSKSLVSEKVTFTNSSFILCHFCRRPFTPFSVISVWSLTETNNATRFKRSYATLLSNYLIILQCYHFGNKVILVLVFILATLPFLSEPFLTA